MSRNIKFKDAVLEATSLLLERDDSVILMGLGVPDPKGIFGTTLGLQERFGSSRVMDIPTAENGVTGVAIGAALTGMRPILTHQRVEFSLLSIEQIINQAAKWCYMTDGKASVPLVIRCIIGRGWGQGPQHSQSLEPIFAHVPGMKVVLPSTASDAKGMLISAVEDNNPVVILEHRWLHETYGEVQAGYFKTDIEKARVVRVGKDLTIVSYSYMLLEVLRAAEVLADYGVEVEVVDLRSIRPVDEETVFSSVAKTGRLLYVDNGWSHLNIGGEIIARVVENKFKDLKSAPKRLGIKDVPIPSTRALANLVYVSQHDILMAVEAQLNTTLNISYKNVVQLDDRPDQNFLGPF